MGVYEEFEPILKWGMFALACLIALWSTKRKPDVFRQFKRAFRRLANHPWWCAAILFVLSISLNLWLASIREPLPWIHDEFSYLLASDTFAEGRLTNPTHPLAEHFESFHILSRPSYMSKYPPASGLTMAAGQFLTGHPITGVWFALALACVATYWMLRAWTSQEWAMTGGLLLTVNGPILIAWGQSYWGGGVALLGGALVFGGIRRIIEQCRLRDAILCGLGLVILANSRPMEGLLVSLPVFAALGWWLVRYREFRFRTKFFKVVMPLVLIGTAAIGLMALFNQSVTGEMSKMPYQVHDRTYAASSMIIWKQPPEPAAAYVHDRMRRYFMEFGRERQLLLRDPAIYWTNLKNKFYLLWHFFLLGMGISFLAAFCLWKDVWFRTALLTIVALLLVESQLASSWMFPHYLAPAVALFLAVNMQCLRYLRLWQRNNKYGMILVRVVLIFAVLKLVPVVVAHQRPKRFHPRDLIEQKLNADAQPDLVIVSYEDDYPTTEDWVYNAANIDRAPIVWARDMGAEKNARLMEYFANRKVWRWHLKVDDTTLLQQLNKDGCLLPRTDLQIEAHP